MGRNVRWETISGLWEQVGGKFGEYTLQPEGEPAM